MGRDKRNEKPQQRGFVSLPWELLNSEAYIQMKPSARAALPYFRGRVKRSYSDNFYYREIYTFTYRHGIRVGFSRATFYTIIKEIVAHGFVDPVDKGGLRCDRKSCSKFKNSKRWEKYGTKEFVHVDWESFEPD